MSCHSLNIHEVPGMAFLCYSAALCIQIIQFQSEGQA